MPTHRDYFDDELSDRSAPHDEPVGANALLSFEGRETVVACLLIMIFAFLFLFISLANEAKRYHAWT